MNARVDPAGLDLADGVYFDMPDAMYHALPRLSATGIKALMTSPATFWAGSWMNPARADDGTPARVIGRAYHCARLEPQAFGDRFCMKPDPATWAESGALMTDAAVKAALKDAGLVQTKAGEVALDRARRAEAEITECPPIASLLIERWEEWRGGRAGIPEAVWDEILDAAELLERTPEVRRHVRGGAAEVTILFDLGGVPFKCRLDYLRPNGFADLKTFANEFGAPLEAKIANAFRLNRYHVQAWLYDRAVEAVRRGDLAAMDDDPHGLVAAIQARAAPLECWWLWQEKGGVPNLLARRVVLRAPHPSHAVNASGADEETEAAVAAMTEGETLLGAKAARDVRAALALYRHCMDLWGATEPWAALTPSADLDEVLFPTFWLEE